MAQLESPPVVEPSPSKSRRKRNTKNVVCFFLIHLLNFFQAAFRIDLPNGSSFEPRFWMSFYVMMDWATFCATQIVLTVERHPESLNVKIVRVGDCSRVRSAS